MRKSIMVTALLLALSLTAAGCSSERSDNKSGGSNQANVTNKEEWFTFSETETEEDFDFGLDEYWIDLNDLEYTTKDKLKCYLFIGTDHSGNEDATDENYQGSMADFLLLAIFNKTEGTYGFIQLNRDTITDVEILDKDGETLGATEEQLCIAHWYGGSRQQSCLNTVIAVSDLLGGLDIDGYYSLGMDEISQLNHMIGGATVTIEDDFSKVDPTLVKGETITLSDEQAYNYLTGRMSVGDGENESRMRRQRTYMEAVYDKVIDQVKSQKNLLEDATETLGDSVTTNMNGDDFGEIRDVLKTGEDLGIFVPDGYSELGIRLDDGLEHTEFFINEEDLANIMIKLCNLQIDEFSDWDELETETEEFTDWDDFETETELFSEWDENETEDEDW